LANLVEKGVFQLVSTLELPIGFGQGADEVLFRLVGGGVGLAVAFEMAGEQLFLAGEGDVSGLGRGQAVIERVRGHGLLPSGRGGAG
jgi:hypothetical protein